MWRWLRRGMRRQPQTWSWWGSARNTGYFLTLLRFSLQEAVPQQTLQSLCLFIWLQVYIMREWICLSKIYLSASVSTLLRPPPPLSSYGVSDCVPSVSEQRRCILKVCHDRQFLIVKIYIHANSLAHYHNLRRKASEMMIAPRYGTTLICYHRRAAGGI